MQDDLRPRAVRGRELKRSSAHAAGAAASFESGHIKIAGLVQNRSRLAFNSVRAGKFEDRRFLPLALRSRRHLKDGTATIPQPIMLKDADLRAGAPHRLNGASITARVCCAIQIAFRERQPS